jgi:hypothetical protein
MDEDGLFRAAERSARAARDFFEPLKAASEADLYTALAVRLQSEDIEHVDEGSATRGARSFGWPYAAAIDPGLLPRDSATRDLGRRIFLRWSKVLYGFACNPDKQDSDLREHLLDAVSGTSGGGMAVIAAVLNGFFGVSQPVAAIIAALTVRLVVAPAVEDVCHSWSALLGDLGSKTKSGS